MKRLLVVGILVIAMFVSGCGLLNKAVDNNVEGTKQAGETLKDQNKGKDTDK